MRLAVSEVDQRSYIALNKWQERRALLTAYRAISRSADGQLYVLIALVAMVWGNDQAALALKTAVLAFGIEVPAFILLKKAIRRDRPFVHLAQSKTALTPSDQFSMPSGHTAAAFVAASLVFVFLPGLSYLAFLWASMVGVSRVVLGVHNPTDVVAGAALGSLSVYIATGFGALL
jgi:undecaprenyl-diphosphatase